MMIGKTYLEYGPLVKIKGLPVIVLRRASWTSGGPRNVLVQRQDGSRVVRPFHGLRVEKQREITI